MLFFFTLYQLYFWCIQSMFFTFCRKKKSLGLLPPVKAQRLQQQHLEVNLKQKPKKKKRTKKRIRKRKNKSKLTWMVLKLFVKSYPMAGKRSQPHARRFRLMEVYARSLRAKLSTQMSNRGRPNRYVPISEK